MWDEKNPEKVPQKSGEGEHIPSVWIPSIHASSTRKVISSNEWGKAASDWVNAKRINEQNWNTYGIPPAPIMPITSDSPSSLVLPAQQTANNLMGYYNYGYFIDQNSNNSDSNKKKFVPNWLKSKNIINENSNDSSKLSMNNNKVLDNSISSNNKLLNENISSNKLLNENISSDKLLIDSVSKSKLLNDKTISNEHLININTNNDISLKITNNSNTKQTLVNSDLDTNEKLNYCVVKTGVSNKKKLNLDISSKPSGQTKSVTNIAGSKIEQNLNLSSDNLQNLTNIQDLLTENDSIKSQIVIESVKENNNLNTNISPNIIENKVAYSETLKIDNNYLESSGFSEKSEQNASISGSSFTDELGVTNCKSNKDVIKPILSLNKLESNSNGNDSTAKNEEIIIKVMNLAKELTTKMLISVSDEIILELSKQTVDSHYINKKKEKNSRKRYHSSNSNSVCSDDDSSASSSYSYSDSKRLKRHKSYKKQDSRGYKHHHSSFNDNYNYSRNKKNSRSESSDKYNSVYRNSSRYPHSGSKHRNRYDEKEKFKYREEFIRRKKSRNYSSSISSSSTRSSSTDSSDIIEDLIREKRKIAINKKNSNVQRYNKDDTFSQSYNASNETKSQNIDKYNPKSNVNNYRHFRLVSESRRELSQDKHWKRDKFDKFKEREPIPGRRNMNENKWKRDKYQKHL